MLIDSGERKCKYWCKSLSIKNEYLLKNWVYKKIF